MDRDGVFDQAALHILWRLVTDGNARPRHCTNDIGEVKLTVYLNQHDYWLLRTWRDLYRESRARS